MGDTRQRLLDAARHCLGQKGLAATTSRDIAAVAGANLAAITYHFGSKDDLVAAALLDGLRAWLAPTIEVLAGDGDPAARTAAAIQSLVRTFQHHRSEAPVYVEALLLASRLAPLNRGLLDLWHELGGLMADQMAGMRAAGVLPSWIDPEAMASLFIAVANGLVLQVTTDPAGPELDAMAAQFGGLLLAAG
jgi:AcrR family transcriptional regulator